MTFQAVYADVTAWVSNTNPGKAAAVGVVAVLAGTLVLACMRYYQKFMEPNNVRRRQVRTPAAAAPPPVHESVWIQAPLRARKGKPGREHSPVHSM
jgi:hypothetical protein